MVRTSRRLKESKVDQKSAEKKYTSEIYLVTLDLNEYDLYLGPYLYNRLKWAFDDENVNIMFDEVHIPTLYTFTLSHLSSLHSSRMSSLKYEGTF